MTDRELLEAAAKAAGIEFDASRRDRALYFTADGRHEDWNPLQDDGDALRLAVKLRISVWHESEGDEGWTVAEARGCGYNECIQPHGDQCAATRRAIVRAAAAMGSSDE